MLQIATEGVHRKKYHLAQLRHQGGDALRADLALRQALRDDLARPDQGQEPLVGGHLGVKLDADHGDDEDTYDVGNHLLVELLKERQLIGPHDAGGGEVLQAGEPLLQTEAHRPQGDAVGEGDVTDHIPPHQPGALVPGVCLEETDHLHGEAVRPGEEHVLLPPPLHHEADVEAEDEHEGDAAQVGVAVAAQRLEQLAGSSPSVARAPLLFISRFQTSLI